MQEYSFGYARISSNRQSIDRQIRNILEYDSKAIIYKETHKRYDLEGRIEFKKLIRRAKRLAKEGNNVKIIFDAVDRFGSDDDCFALYLQLYNLGINMIFLKESYVNTDYIKSRLNTSKLPRVNNEIDFILEGVEKYLERVVFQEVKNAFKHSQLEIDNLKLRTIEGIETARLKGKQIGRRPLDKSMLPPEFFDKYELWKQGKLTKMQFATDMGWSIPKLDRMIEASKRRYITSKEIIAKKYILRYHKEFNGYMSNNKVMNNLKISRGAFFKYKKILKEEIELAKLGKS